MYNCELQLQLQVHAQLQRLIQVQLQPQLQVQEQVQLPPQLQLRLPCCFTLPHRAVMNVNIDLRFMMIDNGNL